MLKKTQIVLLLLAKASILMSLLVLTSCHTPMHNHFPLKQTHKSGLFIVFVGISGSGKSTLAKELAPLINAQVFLEPEESEWQEVITKNARYGNFSVMTAFRNIRVKNLFDAQRSCGEGQRAIVDSYYDKITSFYLGKNGMEWLISPDDPYIKAALTMTQTDTEHLPDADIMILLDPDMETWRSFSKTRNGERDNVPGFKENIQLYKSYIEDAAIKLSQQKGIRLVKYRLINTDGKTQALRLRETLRREKILD